MALGRTTAMINALPDDGAIIVVPSESVWREVSRMIFELRGPDFEGLCRVVIVRDRGDLYKLEGARQRIFFDHTFDVFVHRDVADRVRAFARATDRLFPTAAGAAEYSAIN